MTTPTPADLPNPEQICDILQIGNPSEEECRLVRLGYAAALSAAAPAAPAVTDEDVRDMIGRVESGQAEEEEHLAFLKRLIPPRPVTVAAPTTEQSSEVAPSGETADVLRGLYDAANREAPGPTLLAITNAIQHLQAAQPQAGAEIYPPSMNRQQITDRFGFLEGVVNEANYQRITDEAFAIYSAALRARGAVPSDAEILNRSGCIDYSPGTAEYDLELIRWYRRQTAAPAAVSAPSGIDALLEAIHKLPRYSFTLDSRNNLRRCEEKNGNWLELEMVHALFYATAAVAPGPGVERDAALWREHIGKLDTLVEYCPTCCQGFNAKPEMTRDEVIFECGKTSGRGEFAVVKRALQIACDHIEMDALRVSHCKDAAAIDAAMLAAAPQAPAAMPGEQDAARYRYLRDTPMEDWPAMLQSAIQMQQNARWDSLIDAAMAAAKGRDAGGGSNG